MKMNKRRRILNLWALTIGIFLFSVFFDMASTYLLFQRDYKGMMEHETNQRILGQVKLHGAVGVFIPTVERLRDWLLYAVVGSAVLCGMFFNDFRERYSWGEKFLMCMFMSFLLISILHIGAGAYNLLGLFLGRWSV